MPFKSHLGSSHHQWRKNLGPVNFFYDVRNRYPIYQLKITIIIIIMIVSNFATRADILSGDRLINPPLCFIGTKFIKPKRLKDKVHLGKSWAYKVEKYRHQPALELLPLRILPVGSRPLRIYPRCEDCHCEYCPGRKIVKNCHKQTLCSKGAFYCFNKVIKQIIKIYAFQ